MKRWMALWCLFSIYSGSSVSAAEGEGASLTFSVLTYHVRSAARKNLPLIGAKLDGYDIAAVQGCFNNCESLLDAAHHPNKSYFSERPYWWNRTNSGLASLSNFPLIEVKKVYFKAQAGFIDLSPSKGILLLRYDVNGHIVDVYNTQMQPGKKQLDVAARQFQSWELVQFIGSESPMDHSVILIGDLNMGAAGSTLKAKLKLEDPAEALLGWLENPADQVLFRSGSNTVFKPTAWQDLSEHFVDGKGMPFSDSVPIAVEFSLE